tara:strand:+ start:2959 stop:3531 length:573 start_codon:yes stop_codon:yes gene_type:complete
MNVWNDTYPWELLQGWMTPEESMKWKSKLFKELKWEQPIVKVYGKDYLIPRKTVFLGEKNIQYRYSGITHQAIGWPLWFYPLLEKVSFTCNCQFNGCLVNLYRNGNDKMGWHSDDEKELNPLKSIASLSLGSSRDFYFKHRNLGIKHLISLNNGDLLVMHSPCQDEWMHSVPSRKRNIFYRINLTFRSYK